MAQNTISAFHGIKPKPVKTTSWGEAILNIQTGKYAAAVSAIREIKDPATYRKAKTKLPAVTFGGTFSHRKNSGIKEPTGFIVADIDHLPDVKETFEILKQDEHVWFAFISPRADGIKCGLRSETVKNDADHKPFFADTEKYFDDVYDITIDKACKDISRLTFMSWDPGAYINENASYFDHSELEIPEPDPKPTTTETTPRKQKYGEKVLAGACDKIRNSQPGEQHHTRIEQATLIGGYIPTGYIERDNALAELERAVSDSGAKNMQAAMKDIADGIAHGETKPLDPIAGDTQQGPPVGDPPPEPGPIQGEPAPKPAKVRACTLKDLIKKFDETVCYIWREHIPKGMPIMLAADEGLGKTVTALAMAEEILGDYPDKRILWLAVEGAIGNTINHAIEMGLLENDRFAIAARLIDGAEDYSFNFAIKDHCDRLGELLSSGEYIGVFVDSIRGLSEESVNDEKSANIVRKLNRIVCDKFGAAVCYLHHTNKKEGASKRNTITGSAGLQAAVRAVMLLTKKGTYSRQIDTIKSNVSLETPKLNTVIFNGILEIYPEMESSPSDISKAETFLMELFKTKTEMLSTSLYKLGEAEGLSGNTIKKAKKNIPGLNSKKIDERWHYVFQSKGAKPL